MKYFPISFKPSIADTERGSIVITWNDGETTHTDTIRVQGAGVADTRSFSVQQPTLTVHMCDSVMETIILTNTTCGFLELDSLSLPNGIQLLLRLNGQPQMPVQLKAGETDTLAVEFTPGTEGAGTAPLHLGDTTLTVPVHLQFTDGGATTRFDTTILLQILVERGAPAALVSDTALDFGTISTCDSATLPVVLMSTGCDTLSGTGGAGIGYRVSGMGEFSIGGLQAGSTAPRAPGTSDTILITYIPKNLINPSQDTLFITTNAGTERVALLGTAAPGETSLSADTTPLDFGALFECESRDTTIWLRNPGCDILTIDSASFSNGTNGAYGMDTTFPIFIAKNDSVAVRVHLTSTASTMNGAVTFYSNANSGSQTETVPLRASAIPPAQLQLSLSPSQSAKDGQLVTFYLILSGDTGAAAKKLAGINFDLSHNDDLLSYQSSSGVAVRRGNPLRSIETDTLDWSAGSSASGHTGPDTIGSLSFLVYLTDSSATPLSLSNISLSTPGFEPDCIASIDSNASGFTYLYQCGDHLIQDAMLGVPFTIESIVPNPARTSFVINLSNPASAPIVYTLFDALGNEVFTAMGTGRAQHVPTGGLPSGTYFLRLSQNGYVQSRPVSIER